MNSGDPEHYADELAPGEIKEESNKFWLLVIIGIAIVLAVSVIFYGICCLAQ